MYVLAELAGGALAGLSAWPLYGTGPTHGIWHDMPGKVSSHEPVLGSSPYAHLHAWELYGTGPTHGIWHDMPGKVCWHKPALGRSS